MWKTASPFQVHCWHWWALHLDSGSVSNLSFLQKHLLRGDLSCSFAKTPDEPFYPFRSARIGDWLICNICNSGPWLPFEPRRSLARIEDDPQCRHSYLSVAATVTFAYNGIRTHNCWCFVLQCECGKGNCAHNHPAGKSGQHQRHQNIESKEN